MDSASERQQLESALHSIEAWMEHPFYLALSETYANEQDQLIALITEGKVLNVGDLATREQAIGHLRGLRFFRSCVIAHIEDLKNQIASLT